MTETNPHAAVLRAAGHTAAADLLDSLSSLGTTPPPPGGQPPTAGAPAEAAPTLPDPSEEEGRTLLERLHQDTGGRWRAEEPAA